MKPYDFWSVKFHVGVVLLYKAQTDAEEDFAAIERHVKGAAGVCQIMLISHRWSPNHRNAHDATFPYSIIWTIPYKDAHLYGRKKWSHILSENKIYDIVSRSIARTLKPALKVDNITICDYNTAANMRDCRTAEPVVLREYLT
jgi:hypothetical protein